MTQRSNSLPNICKSDAPNDEFSLNKLRFSSLGLYGREQEILQLKNSFESVRNKNGQGGGRELILISGYSGTGKTALANTLQKPTKENGGFFINGKFDLQQKRSQPLTAFKSAFSQLCDEIYDLKGSDIGKFDDLKSRISYALGSDGHVLKPLIPNIDWLDEENRKCFQSGTNQNDNIEAMTKKKTEMMTGGRDNIRSKNKFHFLIRQFIHAVCGSRYSGPIVFFIDDLQWADVASLDLIENLMSGENNFSGGGLILIGCYRHKNEFDNSSNFPCDTANNNSGSEINFPPSLAARIRAIEQDEDVTTDDDMSCNNERKIGPEATKITRMHISNISVDTINSLLEDLFTSNKADTADLAYIIHKKTQGNIYFVIEFLKSLKQKGLLTYNMGLMKWKWNEEEIKLKMNVTENVAALVRDKMERVLNEESKEVLLMAACLGFTFQTSTLVALMLKTREQRRNNEEDQSDTGRRNNHHHNVSLSVLNSLNLCVNEDLLECEDNIISGADASMSAVTYWFTHDQIQQAALSLVSKEEQQLLQFKMGNILVDILSDEALEKNLFTVVNLINGGLSIHQEEMKRRRLFDLAKLNLRAGRKAMESAAFVPSACYLQTGINLIGPNFWNNPESSALSLELFSTAAKAEFCNTNYDQMNLYIDEVLGRKDIPFKKKIPVYTTLLDGLRLNENTLKGGVEKSFYILSELGVNFSRKNIKFITAQNFLKTKMLLRRKGKENLLNLPLMVDEEKLMTMKILDGLSTLAYLVAPELCTLINLKMVQYSVLYGACQYTPIAFVSYGGTMCFFGDYKSGYQYGQLAMALLEDSKLDTRQIESRVIMIFNLFISHWLAPSITAVKASLRGYKIGMGTGDTESAMYNALSFLGTSLISSRSLVELEKDILHYTEEMKFYKQEMVLVHVFLQWQFVLNLLGKNNKSDPTVLTGDVLNYDEQLEKVEMIKKKDKKSRAAHMFQLMKAFRMILTYYFGEYEMGSELLEEISNFEKICGCHPTLWRKTFFHGLTASAMAQRTHDPKWKKHTTKILKTMKKWVSKGNVNCVHCIHLLKAEEMAYMGKTDEAIRYFCSSITAAGRAGFIHDKALANERAGVFFLNNGDENQALFHFQRAHELYVEWGAKAKADHLNKKYSFLMP